MMGWMMDEYSKLRGKYVPGVITGKPVGGGGSLGRTAATGFGVVVTIREAMQHLGIESVGKTASIQGFGNVAQHAACAFIEMLGGRVISVSCWDREDAKAYTYTKRRASTRTSFQRSPTSMVLSTRSRPKRPVTSSRTGMPG